MLVNFIYQCQNKVPLLAAVYFLQAVEWALPLNELALGRYITFG